MFCRFHPGALSCKASLRLSVSESVCVRDLKGGSGGVERCGAAGSELTEGPGHRPEHSAVDAFPLGFRGHLREHKEGDRGQGVRLYLDNSFPLENGKHVF